MKENKLTDKEIIKALECCITNNKKRTCKDCPYIDVKGYCYDTLNKDALT